MDVDITRQRLTIEGFHCDIIPSIELCYTFFEHFSDALDMRILIPPTIVRVPVVSAHQNIQVRTDDIGISGQLIWLESGSQIHTWPTKRFITLDLFTCKRFKVEKALDIFESWFKPKEIKYYEPINFKIYKKEKEIGLYE